MTAMRLVALLLLALFAFANITDAAACSAEPATDYAQSEAALADGDDPGQPDDSGDGESEDHALCAHGHCHHFSQATAPDQLESPAIKADSLLGPARVNILHDHHITRLKRPPRA